jgi:two-component system cell cycle sensor histidine kinase/response regulator CckA
MIAMEAKRVLFVDDDALVSQLTGATLRRLGHDVATFLDAESALAAFRSDPSAYDLLVSDLRLGAASGFALAEAVRELRPDLPVVVASGHVGHEEEARARALGLTAVLNKAEVLTGFPQLLARVFG